MYQCALRAGDVLVLEGRRFALRRAATLPVPDLRPPRSGALGVATRLGREALEREHADVATRIELVELPHDADGQPQPQQQQQEGPLNVYPLCPVNRIGRQYVCLLGTSGASDGPDACVQLKVVPLG